MYPNIKTQIKKRTSQSMQMQGINLTDNYNDGQLESSKGISTERFPYITTAKKLVPVDTGIPEGFQAVSMYAWDKLFVISNEYGENGYKCYYGGEFCGEVPTLDIPKQYAVVNTKLVVFPDKMMFTKTEEGVMSSQPMSSASLLLRVNSGTVEYRKAVSS